MAPSFNCEGARAARATAAASPVHYEAHHNRGVAAGRLAAVARGAPHDATSGRGTPCAAGVADDASRFEAEAGAAFAAGDVARGSALLSEHAVAAGATASAAWRELWQVRDPSAPKACRV